MTIDTSAVEVKDVQIVVPYATISTVMLDEGESVLDDLATDEELASAIITVTAQYPAENVGDAAKLMFAAETLGFHCHYTSGDINNNETMGMVTITMKGVPRF